MLQSKYYKDTEKNYTMKSANMRVEVNADSNENNYSDHRLKCSAFS